MTYMIVDAIIRNFEITGEVTKIIPIESWKKGLPLYFEYDDKFSEI
jgi:uncharacterized protein with HEPN domain